MKDLSIILFTLYTSLANVNHTATGHNIPNMLSYIVTQVETVEIYESIQTKSRITSFRCNILCMLNSNGCNRVKKTNEDENGLIDCQLLKVMQKTSQQLSTDSLVQEIRDRNGNIDIDGAWSPWQPEGGCNVSCGVGYMSERRTCTSPAPSGNGNVCVGDETRESHCNTSIICEVPVDGGWSGWLNVADCTKTCGTGTQQRTRSCTNPEPSGGGLDCTGADNTQVDCNTLECPEPVDGVWSEWQNVGDCTKTCGTGTQQRTRSCTNPEPSGGGLYCTGADNTEVDCNPLACPEPVDGVWSEWQNVGNCSEICGIGVQQKTRSCTNPEPAHGGLDCAGLNNNQIDCNTFACSAANLHLMQDEGTAILTDIGNKNVLIDIDGAEAWIVIQNHVVGNLDFNRSWEEYKSGFGIISANEDFWLGNNVIYTLCNLYSNLRLKIQLISATRNDVVEYNEFTIDEESNSFWLSLNGYTGSMEDSFGSTHHGQMFSTFDNDNDGTAVDNCASKHGSGWWFNSCFKVSLNSKLKWNDFGQPLAYQQTIMKIQINTL